MPVGCFSLLMLGKLDLNQVGVDVYTFTLFSFANNSSFQGK